MEKKREIFLEHLPRQKGYGGKRIDWKSSAGYKVRFVYNDIEGEILILGYTVKNQMLKVKYNEKDFDIKTTNFSRCEMGRVLGIYTTDFRFNLGDEFKDNKRDIFIIDRYINVVNNENKRFYNYKCNKCGHIDCISEYDLMYGTGCSSCSKTRKKVVLGINTIWDTDRWMCDLGVSEEDAKTHTRAMNKKITVKCPDCGKEKEVQISHISRRKTIGCSCGDGRSYPSKLMNSILTQLEVEFIQEYSPDYLIPTEGKKYRKFSDFFLPLYNLVIETDGGMNHKGGKVHSRTGKTLEEMVAIDEWKDSQHLQNGVDTIRIDCLESDLEYIKNNILNSNLSKIFDLSKINWLKAEEFAMSNRVKEVCFRWNKREEWETTNDLVKELGISESAIRSYLKRGTTLNWTYYDSTIEAKRAIKKANEMSRLTLGKEVSIFKDGEILGTFASCRELEKCSESLFGVKLNHSVISGVCNGKYKQHRGYTFKYTKDLTEKERIKYNIDNIYNKSA